MNIEVLRIVAESVVALGVALWGGKSVYDWFFLPQDKRAKEVDNQSRVVETLEKALQMLQTRLETSDADSAQKQEIIVEQQKQLFQERAERARLEQELAVANFLKCDVKACQKRNPPTGY